MARALMLLYGILTTILMWPAALVLLRRPNFTGTILQRLGLKVAKAPLDGVPVIWMHTASVGEVKAAAGLIRAVKRAFPGHSICLSAMTATGRQVASGIPELDLVMPLPFDSPLVMRRYMNSLKPNALVIVETELWPGMIMEAKRRGIPVVFVNARMTERSFRRYSALKHLAGLILSDVHVLAMAGSDGARFARLGAGEAKTLGNLKLDSISEVDLTKREGTRELLGAGKRPVFIAGSIREGEEEAVIEAVKRAASKMPGLLSILAPRHPGQIGTLAELSRQNGFVWCLKSRYEKGANLVIVDTMGELFGLYGASDVAFVGGSLVDLGGQNILEPIAWGVPTVHGPHMGNFTWALEAVKGLTITVQDSAGLGDTIVDVLTKPGNYRGRAQEARSLLEQCRGITDRYVDELKRFIG